MIWHRPPHINLTSHTWLFLPGLPPPFSHTASDQKLESGTRLLSCKIHFVSLTPKFYHIFVWLYDLGNVSLKSTVWGQPCRCIIFLGTWMAPTIEQHSCLLSCHYWRFYWGHDLHALTQEPWSHCWHCLYPQFLPFGCHMSTLIAATMLFMFFFFLVLGYSQGYYWQCSHRGLWCRSLGPFQQASLLLMAGCSQCPG